MSEHKHLHSREEVQRRWATIGKEDDNIIHAYLIGQGLSVSTENKAALHEDDIVTYGEATFMSAFVAGLGDDRLARCQAHFYQSALSLIHRSPRQSVNEYPIAYACARGAKASDFSSPTKLAPFIEGYAKGLEKVYDDTMELFIDAYYKAVKTVA